MDADQVVIEFDRLMLASAVVWKRKLSGDPEVSKRMLETIQTMAIIKIGAELERIADAMTKENK